MEPKVRTEIREVAFQVGFFFEPIYHIYHIEVPVFKQRKGAAQKKKKENNI
jgi:hypothetical protein